MTAVWLRMLVVLAGVLSLAGPAAAAPEAPRADYGPTTVCLGGYAFAVDASEMAIVFGPREFRLQGDDLTLTATEEPAAADERKPRTSTLMVAGLGAVTRYDYPRDRYGRAGIPGEVVFVDEPAHTEYLLPAVGALGAVRVTAIESRRRAGDEAALKRFVRRDAATRCDRLSDDATGQRIQEVLQWAPAKVEGPRFLCQGALGLPLRAGESAQHTWKQGREGVAYWRVTGKDYQVAVFAWRPRATRGKPTGRVLSLGYRTVRNGEHITLWPPASYAKDPADDGLIHINAVGLTDAALEGFLGRLEYLGPSDRRC